MDDLYFMGLLPKLESEEFLELSIESVDSKKPELHVEPLHGEGSSRVFRLYQTSGSNPSKSLDGQEVITVVSSLFEEGYYRVSCKMTSEHIIYSKKPKGIQILSEPSNKYLAQSKSNIDIEYLIESPKIRALLAKLGVISERGVIRQQQLNKLIQIKNFVKVFYESLSQFQDRKTINIVDAACGKSYLSFVLSYFLREEWGYNAHFQGIDRNDRLISHCESIQNSLSFPNMEFYASTVNDFTSNERVDVLFSLHGCNTATDEAIAAGVRLNSQVIIVIPCCHFELREQLKNHPLKGITKYGLFEERFATLLTDALRSLALEAAGYNVTSFRFVTDDVTPKNTLLRAIKQQAPNPNALQEYYRLRDMFNVSPTIERLLPLVFQKEQKRNGKYRTATKKG